MNKDVIDLVNSIKDTTNPGIIASKISHFVVESMRKEKINLYEAYMVNYEFLKFERLWYTQPAWGGWSQISRCIDILNQKLLAHVFDENTNAKRMKEWGLEAFRLSNEKRKHHIMDRYNLFLDANEQPQLLKELLKYRQNYKKLSFDDGPYHTESFPYNYYSPEEILLDSAAKEKFIANMSLSEDIENLIVELNLI